MARIYTRRDYVGNKYGRLTILNDEHDIVVNGLNVRIVKCKCDCGTVYTPRLHSLTNGSILSCGCLHKEKAKQTCIERNTTHSDSDSKEYNAWQMMISRCYNKNRSTYKNYGGRGIAVDESWKSSYTSFLSDIGRAPNSTNEWSVGRKDNNENYSPSNCMWEIWDQQARNRGMQDNNTSGVTGVCERNRKGSLSYEAYWYDFELQKRKSRSFSISKHGREAALLLATECRVQAISEMNTRGAGYTPEHGKQRLVKETHE